MKRLTILFGCVLLIFMATHAVSVRSSATITIDGADNFTTKQISVPNSLSSLLNNIADRIVLQFSDFKSELTLTTPPDPFSEYLNNISDRIVKQYADGERKLTIAAVPSSLNNYLGAISDRTAMRYVDQSRPLTLGYPKDLFGDKSPPLPPANPPSIETSGTTITISWTTDEFTTFVIHIGTSSGVYTIQVSGAEFKKQHQVSISELPQAETYFYQIVSSDLSGNSATSQEYMLEAGEQQHVVYLPFAKR